MRAWSHRRGAGEGPITPLKAHQDTPAYYYNLAGATVQSSHCTTTSRATLPPAPHRGICGNKESGLAPHILKKGGLRLAKVMKRRGEELSRVRWSSIQAVNGVLAEQTKGREIGWGEPAITSIEKRDGDAAITALPISAFCTCTLHSLTGSGAYVSGCERRKVVQVMMGRAVSCDLMWAASICRDSARSK